VVDDSGEDLRTTGIGVIRSAIGVPLIKGGRFAAAFGVHHTEPRRWTEAEVKLVEETADRTWDAVERARAEAALRESEERRHLALDSTQMGTFLWHVDEDRGEPDTQMLALFGLPEDGSLTLAEALATLIHPDDRADYAEAVARATDPAGDGRLRREIRVVHADGSNRWLAITGQTVFETGPRRAVRMSGVATDITERRQAETERERQRTREAAMRAEAAERERISRELHDRVAHSMGVVYQNLQLYRALAENAPERAREKLAVAEETARSALDQTRNLAIELRRSVAEETEEGVAKALWSLLDTSAPDGVVTGLSFSGDESLVPRDVGAQVYLVMREAIRNALQHSGCEELGVGLEIRPDELVGTVNDDGEGFDPEAVHQAGIGLGSMRERAEMLGGDLKVTSHPGEGTTVEIRLPLEG
jgi:PAS domain S-box-containing protein